MNKVGIFVHSRWSAATRLAKEVSVFLRENGVADVWITTDWEDTDLSSSMPDTELLICLGGDGTVLRAARTVVPNPVPILGVNMGRLGFLAEVRPGELLERLPDVLAGRHRIEQRAMLEAHIPSFGVTYQALNDVVLGRRTVARPVYVDVSVDGSRLAVHRCDAMIVATATGSTAYSMSAGGPILYPESKDLLLTPVSPHMTGARPLVLAPDSVVQLAVGSGEDAVVSLDGQIDRDVSPEDIVSVRRSEHVARFLRFSKPEVYWGLLAERLDWLRVLQASENPELFDLDGIPSAK